MPRVGGKSTDEILKSLLDVVGRRLVVRRSSPMAGISETAGNNEYILSPIGFVSSRSLVGIFLVCWQV